MKAPGQLAAVPAIVLLAAGSAWAQPADGRTAPTSGPRAGRLILPAAIPAQTQPAAAALHPSAKGALIGAAVGAGAMGAVGVWYCTVGPSEAGECGRETWTRPLLLGAAAGAAIGALIGAMR